MPHIGLLVLAIIDILSGLLLYFHPSFLVRPFFYLGVICLTKGGWSVISSFLQRFYFDILGLLDMIAGLFLVLLYQNISFPFFSVFGIMIILKGLWTMFFSITS